MRMHHPPVVAGIVVVVVSPHIDGHTLPSHVILHCDGEVRRRHRKKKRVTRHEGESGRGTGRPLATVVDP
jgi:hypothetical protein